MNRFAFALIAWLTLGFELGLRSPLRLQVGGSNLSPSFMLIAATLIALGTTPTQTAWACLILGMLIDLTWAVPVEGAATATILGPYTIGFVLLGQVVLAVRGQLIRKNPLTLAFLTLVGGAATHMVVAGILTLRSFYDPVIWDVGQQLVERFGTVVYTAVFAWLLGVVLFWFPPMTLVVESTGLDFTQGRSWGRRA